MAANPPPDGGGGNEHDAVRLAQIKAAMMEELGIGRIAELHLDDRQKRTDRGGPNASRGNPAFASRGRQPRVESAIVRSKDTKKAVSAWKNFTPDDVDPEEELLEHFGGQLARMRRGGGPASTSRGGHHGSGPRGGGGSAHMNNRSSSAALSSPTPSTFLNDHRNVDGRAANRYPIGIDVAVARLRGQDVSSFTSGPQYTPAPRPALAVSAPRPTPVPQRSNPSSATPPVKPPNRWNNVSVHTSDFLSYAGLSDNVPSGQAVASLPAAASISHKPAAPSLVPAPVRVEPTPEVVQTVPTQVPIQAEARTTSSRDQVRNSQAEETTPVAVETIVQSEVMTTSSRDQVHSSQVILPPPISTPSHTSSALARSIWNTDSPSKFLEHSTQEQRLREHQVLIAKNKETPLPGTAKLLRSHAAELIIELLQHDSIVVRELIGDDCILAHDTGSVSVTYKAAEKEGVVASTWTIIFQMSYQANKFVGVVTLNRQGYPVTRPTARQLSSGRQEPSKAVAAHPREGLPVIEPSPHVEATSRVGPEDLKHVVDDIVVDVASDAVGPVLASEEISSSMQLLSISDTVAAAEVETTSIPVSEGQSLQPPFFDFGTLMEEQPIALSPFDSPPPDMFNRSSSFGAHIATQTLNDMESVAGFKPLINFEEEDVVQEPEEMSSATDDLNALQDESISRGTLDYLNKSPNGTLLSQLSRLAVKKDAAPAQELTREQILSSEQYLTVAYDLVGNFLSASETFSTIPEDLSIMLMKEQTRFILTLALEGHEPTSRSVANTQALPAVETPRPVNLPSSGTPTVKQASTSSRAPESVQSYRDRSVSAASSRVTYQPDDLMQLRNSATAFHRERLPDEISHLARSPLGPRNHNIAPSSSANSALSRQSSSVAKKLRMASPVKLVALESGATTAVNVGDWGAMMAISSKPSAVSVATAKSATKGLHTNGPSTVWQSATVGDLVEPRANVNSRSFVVEPVPSKITSENQVPAPSSTTSSSRLSYQIPTKTTGIKPSAPEFSPAAPANTNAGPRMFNNANLQGRSGLSASRYAPTAGEMPYLGQPAYTSPQYQGQAHPPANAVPMTPVFQTVVVMNPDGSTTEVTGMLKTGSIPIIAHAPVPQGFGSGFPARPNQHYSPTSVPSDNFHQVLKATATPYQPVSHGEYTPRKRATLSSVRREEDAQAKLQARLDSSLASRWW